MNNNKLSSKDISEIKYHLKAIFNIFVRVFCPPRFLLKNENPQKLISGNIK